MTYEHHGDWYDGKRDGLGDEFVELFFGVVVGHCVNGRSMSNLEGRG